MPRGKTCREKFVGGFNQKNCDKNEECKQAEIDLKLEKQQARVDKAMGLKKDKPPPVIITVPKLSYEEKQDFIANYKKMQRLWKKLL